VQQSEMPAKPTTPMELASLVGSHFVQSRGDDSVCSRGMAEQWIRLFAVSAAKLEDFVGSNDVALANSIAGGDGAEEVAALIEERDCELGDILADVVRDELDDDHAYLYRRALEAVASELGQDTHAEATMPGRGWQELGPAWRHWGATRVGGVWGGEPSGNKTFPWPWTEVVPERECRWPVAVVFANKDLESLIAELESFDVKTIAERGVPSEVSRFSEQDYWPLDDLAGEIANVISALRGGARVARREQTDLLLWHDGQQ